MIPFNYHHLYYFFKVAEEGSISKAAKSLRLAQPTLSTQLKQFESFLDRQLFIRQGKKLVLTGDGTHILGYAKAIFDLGKEMTDSLESQNQKGLIRIQIGISSFIPRAFVDSLLKFLLRNSPAVHVNLIERSPERMLEALKTHKLDMVLNDLPFQEPPEEGIENHLIAKLPVVLCAHASIANKYKKIPQDLDHAPMIMPTSQSQIHHTLQEYFLTHKVKPDIIAEIQDLELVRRLVLSGMGIAPMNQYSVMNAPSKEKLVILSNWAQLKISHTVYLIRKRRKNPHLLISQILDNFRLLPL